MAGERHIWEGKISQHYTCLRLADGGAIGTGDMLSKIGAGKYVRITVEVLETAGGATKEAVQHES